MHIKIKTQGEARNRIKNIQILEEQINHMMILEMQAAKTMM